MQIQPPEPHLNYSRATRFGLSRLATPLETAAQSPLVLSAGTATSSICGLRLHSTPPLQTVSSISNAPTTIPRQSRFFQVRRSSSAFSSFSVRISAAHTSLFPIRMHSTSLPYFETDSDHSQTSMRGPHHPNSQFGHLISNRPESSNHALRRTTLGEAAWFANSRLSRLERSVGLGAFDDFVHRS